MTEVLTKSLEKKEPSTEKKEQIELEIVAAISQLTDPTSLKRIGEFVEREVIFRLICVYLHVCSLFYLTENKENENDFRRGYWEEQASGNKNYGK